MTDYRFFSFKNVRAKVLFNIQKPVTTLLPMTSQWRFAKLVNCFVQKLSLIFVLLKQSLAANRIHLPAGWRASIHSAQRTELAAGQLSRFHHKEPVASKFAEYKPNGLSRVGCNVGAYRKLKTKPKTIAELNKAFQVIWGGDPTRLWKTSQIKRLKTCVGAWSWRWTLRTFAVTMEFCQHLIIS